MDGAILLKPSIAPSRQTNGRRRPAGGFSAAGSRAAGVPASQCGDVLVVPIACLSGSFYIKTPFPPRG